MANVVGAEAMTRTRPGQTNWATSGYQATLTCFVFSVFALARKRYKAPVSMQSVFRSDQVSRSRQVEVDFAANYAARCPEGIEEAPAS